MTPSQIITEEAKKVGYDPAKVMATVHKFVTTGAGFLLNKNNSALLLIPIDKSSVELHLFTVDKPARLLNSLKYFVSKIKESSIKNVYGSANKAQNDDLKKVLEILDNLGIDVQKSNRQPYTWMATVEGSK
jgi:hypothetical protein